MTGRVARRIGPLFSSLLEAVSLCARRAVVGLQGAQLREYFPVSWVALLRSDAFAQSVKILLVLTAVHENELRLLPSCHGMV